MGSVPPVDGSRRPEEFKARKKCDICGRYWQRRELTRQEGAVKCPECLDKIKGENDDF